MFHCSLFILCHGMLQSFDLPSAHCPGGEHNPRLSRCCAFLPSRVSYARSIQHDINNSILKQLSWLGVVGMVGMVQSLTERSICSTVFRNVSFVIVFCWSTPIIVNGLYSWSPTHACRTGEPTHGQKVKFWHQKGRSEANDNNCTKRRSYKCPHSQMPKAHVMLEHDLDLSFPWLDRSHTQLLSFTGSRQ